MDLYKLIQALEKLIFEVASWLVFIPRTLAITLVRPDRISAFVQREFDRPAAERFPDRLSPPLFWVIVGVLPVFAVIEVLRKLGEQPQEPTWLDPYILPGWSIEAKVFTVALALLSGPIAFALATRLLQRRPMSRAELEPAFHAQCCIFAPFQLLASAAVLVVLSIVIEILVQALSVGLSAGLGRGAALRPAPPWFSGWTGDLAIAACVVVPLVWFLAAQAWYFMQAFAEQPTWRGRALRALAAFVLAVLVWALLVGAWVLGSQAVVGVLELAGRVPPKTP